MRILVLTNLFPSPLQPHIAPWNRAQFRALAVRNEVRVIAPVAWSVEWRARRAGRAMGLDRRSVCDGIEVVHPRYYFPPGVMRGTYGECFRRSVAGTFRRVMREFSPDVMIASWAYPDGWAAVQLAAESQMPVVIKVHGSDILTLDRYPGRRRPTVEALQNADQVVTVSRHLANSVESLGVSPGKIAIVRNGIDADKFFPGPRAEARERLGLDRDEPIVLFVGNLVEVKQVDVLVKACAQLAERAAPFHLHLLGVGPLQSSLEDLVRKAGLGGRVTFHGSKPQDQLADWYRSANVVALPSRSEGIPNVLLEASACGIPFVASNIGGIPEIAAGNRNRLVPQGDIESLTIALGQSLNESCHTLSALPNVIHSWKESAKILEEVLRKTLSRCRTVAVVDLAHCPETHIH